MDGIRYLGPLEAWGERWIGELGTVLQREGNEGGGNPSFRKERNPSPKNAARQAYTLFNSASATPEPLLLASQVMRTPAISLVDSANLTEADMIFQVNGFSHLPILGPEGTLIGMISAKDLLHLRANPPRNSQPNNFHASPVREWMRSPVLAVSPDTDLRQVARLMVEKKSDCLPVVDAGGALIGIITRTDILLSLVKYPELRIWA